MKELDSYKQIQERLFLCQKATLEEMKKYQQNRIKFLIKKEKLQPIKGIIKSTGKPCIVWIYPKAQPQEILYNTKDLGEEYYLKQQRRLLDEITINAIPQTGCQPEALEPEVSLDKSLPRKIKMDKANKEFSMERI